MAEKVKCEACDRNFKNLDGLEAHNKAKHPGKTPKEKKKLPVKKIKNWGIFLGIVVLAIWGVVALIFNSGGGLPPTTMQGHIEANPESHVLKKPMRLDIQKHMLEHADGKDGESPGIIINYDCDNYDCSSELIEKLEAFATKYPENVYVAPFKNMDVKIALTRLGRIETLDEYNEQVIESFIR
jgi:hypothetical protein